MSQSQPVLIDLALQGGGSHERLQDWDVGGVTFLPWQHDQSIGLGEHLRY
jgi:hypothetical protein